MIIAGITRSEPYSDSSGEGEYITLVAKVQSGYRKNDRLILELTEARELPEEISFNGEMPEIPKTFYKKEKGIGVLAYMDDNLKDQRRPKCGSRVVIEGKKSLFERAENFGQFDMAVYEQGRGMDHALFEAKILAAGNEYDVVRETLLEIRERAAGVYAEVFTPEEAGVLDSMVLGDRSSLPAEIKGLYQRSGIAHALSISGLHIGIIGYGLYKLLKRLRLGPYPCTGISTAVMLLYCALTGSPLSAVRSFIMFALALYADICSRSYDMLSAMALSMMILLAYKPLVINEAGFWLSYCAVTGAAVMFPHIKKLVPTNNRIINAFLFSLSISVFTFPVTAYFFYQIPLYSIFLNLTVVPLLGVLLFSALVTAAAGTVNMFLPLPFIYICKLILGFLERSCRLCEKLPYGMIVTGKPEVWKIILYYTGLIILVITSRKLKGYYAKITVNCIAVMVLTALITVKIRPFAELTMLSVGQGQCIYIRSPDGVSCLYDCGSSSVKDTGEYRVIPFLKASGVGSLDYCIVSHTDEDHISGFIELFGKTDSGSIKIRRLIMPDIGNPDEEYNALIKAAAENGTKVYKVSRGDEFELGDFEVRCLNPDRGVSYEDKNTYSAVLELKYKDFSALLTGDVQDEGEETAEEEMKGNYTLLQVAHHGSKNSSPDSFLEKADPELALISCGKGNRYKHPHTETLQRLRKVTDRIYITKDTGAVTVTTNGKKVRVSTYLFLSREENKNEKISVKD